MFDHIQIKVVDLAASRPFYTALLAELGHGVVLDLEGVIGIGPDVHNMIEIRQAGEDAPLSKSVHIAFVADSAEAVRRFHQTAIDLGARDNGAPGLRPDYEDGYFAAFVIDPNGHNLEAVYSGK